MKGTSSPRELAPCGFETQQQLASDCAHDGPGLCAVDKLQDRQAHNALFWYDLISQYESAAVDQAASREMRDRQRRYGAMPLIVLTADDGPRHDLGLPPHIPQSQVRARWMVWKTMHDELAANSSVGVNFVVADTGHYIHQDQPSAVVSAISEVLMQARAGR